MPILALAQLEEGTWKYSGGHVPMVVNGTCGLVLKQHEEAIWRPSSGCEPMAVLGTRGVAPKQLDGDI